jgi:hypothetical protein
MARPHSFLKSKRLEHRTRLPDWWTSLLSVAKLPFAVYTQQRMRSNHARARGAKDINAIPRQANLLHSSGGLEIQAFSHLTATEPLAKA